MKRLTNIAQVFGALLLAYASPCAAGDNTIGGSAAGLDVTTGTDNTILGTQAGVAVTTGTDNTLVGYKGGYGVTGSHNIILGEDPSSAITTGSSNILLGNSLTEVTNSSSSQLDIGDTLYGTLGGSGTITAANSFTAVGTITGNLFSGSGASLTSLNGSNISSGTVAVARLPTGTVITNTASPAQGDILYYNGSDWIDLAAGTSGYFLETQGASANPTWAVAGNGTVNSGTEYDLGYYAATGTAISGSSAITTDSGGDLTSTGTITGNLFSGSGASLTSLDGSNISSGTVGAAYLPTGTVITSTASPAQGDILYYNGSNWVDLAAGTSGEFLETQGASANPKWTAAVGSGVINSGTQYQLGYYANTGTTMSGDANITTDSSNDLNLVSASAGLEIDGDKILSLPDSSTTNIAVGYQALLNNSSSVDNTAVGGGAMHGSSSSPMSSFANDTAIGYEAMYSVEGGNGQDDTAVGNSAAYYESTGAENTAIGSNAMEGASASLLTGDFNTAVGAFAMWQVQGAAGYNTAVGSSAGYSATTGTDNTVIGWEAGYDTTTGTDNTLVGYAAGIAVTGNYNIMVGEDPSHAITTGSNNILVGNSLTSVASNGDYQIDIGDVLVVTGAGTPSTSSTTIEGAVTVGGAGTIDGALTVDGAGTVDGVLTVGGTDLNISNADASLEIGSNSILSLPDSNTTNIAVGYQALLNNSTSVDNTAVGGGAMHGSSSSPMSSFANDTAVGYTAMYSVEGGNGQDDTAVGNSAAYYESTGAENTAIGSNAMEGASGSLLTGDYNVAVGSFAMNSLQGTAEYNTALGASAGYDITTGTDNTLVGYEAGVGVTGSHNIILGEDPSSAITSGNSNILIGNSLADVTKTSSGQLDIGDLIFGAVGSAEVGIGQDSPAYQLDVGNSSSSGAVMRLQNSSGACTYTPGSSSVTVSCSSDVTEKKDISDSAGALAWLSDMRVRDFTWKKTGERRTGVIAQEIQKAHPDMVHKGPDGYLTVDEPNPWKLVEAIQEQKKEIDDLKAELKTLRGQDTK